MSSRDWLYFRCGLRVIATYLRPILSRKRLPWRKFGIACWRERVPCWSQRSRLVISQHKSLRIQLPPTFAWT